MCPGAVVVLLVRAQHMPQMALAEHDHMVEALASDRADQSFSVTVLPRRSRRRRSVANAHRANAARICLAVDTVAITNEVIRHRSHPQASLTCRAIQSAVGDGVTPTQRIRLRSCPRIRRPYSNLNEIVGTTKRSIEAIPPVWLRRNVLQPCDGGRLRRAIYFATEVWPMSIPSLRSSP